MSAAVLVIASLSGSAPSTSPLGAGYSGAAGVASPSASSPSAGVALRVSAPKPCPPGTRAAGKGCVTASAAYVERCPIARNAVRWYRQRHADWLQLRGADRPYSGRSPRSCADARYLAELWRKRALAARRAYERWLAYHYDWRSWLSEKWQRVGACETGYGRRPGDWRWNSGTYQGAFGFYFGSWDAFVPFADPRAGPYPSEAYDATPRQQYEVALAIWRRYGFSGWGCRSA